MSNNRENIYKTLEKEYLRKANATQKPKVRELLNLYKSGKIFSKVTMQKTLNRYLGRHANEASRDLYFYKTMLTNINDTKSLAKDNKKVEKAFEKAEHV
jgi:hypothetical protein